MTVEWKFSSLNSLADHLDNKAIDLRKYLTTNGEGKMVQSRINFEKRARATELESIAYMLRHSEITEK